MGGFIPELPYDQTQCCCNGIRRTTPLLAATDQIQTSQLYGPTIWFQTSSLLLLGSSFSTFPPQNLICRQSESINQQVRVLVISTKINILNALVCKALRVISGQFCSSFWGWKC
ncbi:hypothetical protein ILYODFUR_009439 [Ilyodon furcidens]|uniref:Uncharacterized protein n=1 Tax=Ilyodon furcidens TaxID=33524 RepID=A0ABV0U3Z8_9TELE